MQQCVCGEMLRRHRASAVNYHPISSRDYRGIFGMNHGVWAWQHASRIRGLFLVAEFNAETGRVIDWEDVIDIMKFVSRNFGEDLWGYLEPL